MPLTKYRIKPGFNKQATESEPWVNGPMATKLINPLQPLPHVPLKLLIRDYKLLEIHIWSAH